MRYQGIVYFRYGRISKSVVCDDVGTAEMFARQMFEDFMHIATDALNTPMRYDVIPV